MTGMRSPRLQVTKEHGWLSWVGGWSELAMLTCRLCGAESKIGEREGNASREATTLPALTATRLRVPTSDHLPPPPPAFSCSGGCFWGTELHFQRLDEVIATCVGYTQGNIDAPTYGEVCFCFPVPAHAQPACPHPRLSLSPGSEPWSGLIVSLLVQILLMRSTTCMTPLTRSRPTPSHSRSVALDPCPPPAQAISPALSFSHPSPLAFHTYAPSFSPPPQVCSGRSGHTEAVQLIFDPKLTSYRSLCDTLLSTIDPTALNRVNADIGTQYRHGIYFHSRQQHKARSPQARTCLLYLQSRVPDQRLSTLCVTARPAVLRLSRPATLHSPPFFPVPLPNPHLSPRTRPFQPL
jgi:peptide methionine sulfoxide reductase MsrA